MPSYEEVTQQAGSVRALTGLTAPEFTALLPHFEHAFEASRRDRTMDGQPRTSRRYTTDATCPLPTMADTLLFILTFVKQNPIQEIQGQLFGMSPANANKWIHLLQTVLTQALAHQDLLPARTAEELAALLATTPSQEGPTSPLVGLMVRHGQSSGRKTLRNGKSITVARRRATRSKTSW